MSTPDSSITITASEIAQLAGVGRSTVSNWRQRHDDFPQPVDGDAASPRFLAADIRAWLKANNKKVKDLPTDSAIWSAANILRGTVTLEDMGGLIGSLLAWRYVSDADSEGFDETLPLEMHWSQLREAAGSREIHYRIASGMQSYEMSHPENDPLFSPILEGRIAVFDKVDSGSLHALIHALSSFPASSIGEAFIAFNERLTTSARRGYDEWATSTPLVDLVAKVAEGVPGPVHDPVAGSGRLLLAVSGRGEDRTAATGQDINVGACAQANQRALVTGRRNVTVRLGDVFQTDYFEKGLAQVVVMDPPYTMSYQDHGRLYLDARLPYGPPAKTSMDTAWLQIALWYLAPGGRAFVLQPPASAFQSGPTGRVRTAMLQDGVVEAVVALPGGMASNTHIPLNLWVLRRPNQGSDPARVLLIDQSQTKDIAPDVIAAALREWRERRAIPTSLPAGAFTVAEILAKDGVLSPQRWVSYSTAQIPEAKDVFTHIEKLQSAVADLKPLSRLTREAFIPGGQVPKLITVSDLAKAGEVVLLKANGRVREGDYGTEGTPVVSGSWIRGTEIEPRRIDLSILEHPPVITEPGDVLVQNTGGLAARVDTVGGKVLLSPSFQLLRLQGNALLPEYLAEFVVTASNQRQSLGTTIQRIRVQDLKIPLLPLANQKQVVERIGESRQLQAGARALLQAASTVRDSLVEGIASGVVEVANEDVVDG